jgi:hypothetical protein
MRAEQSRSLTLSYLRSSSKHSLRSAPFDSKMIRSFVMAKANRQAATWHNQKNAPEFLPARSNVILSGAKNLSPYPTLC